MFVSLKKLFSGILKCLVLCVKNLFCKCCRAVVRLVCCAAACRIDRCGILVEDEYEKSGILPYSLIGKNRKGNYFYYTCTKFYCILGKPV